MEAQRRIAVLWQACRPGEPDETAYRSALQNIEARLLVPTPVLSSRRFRLPWVLGFAAAAAVAATVLIVLANRPEGSSTIPAPDFSEGESPWPVASADDVFISSIASAEADPIVVGDPPIRDGLALVRPGEIDVMAMTPEPGINPRYQPDSATVPMIFTEPAEAVPGAKLP